jgi:hypothetical protein
MSVTALFYTVTAMISIKQLFPEGGAACEHVQSRTDQRHYDATCRKLYAFRSKRS